MEDGCLEKCLRVTREAQTRLALHPTIRIQANHGSEYAAAFFLLGDSLKDAVSVILNQLKDLQLAIAVTRVYEGEHGPVLKELLQDKVLPLAAQEGNRWLASWAFWMLHRRDMAVRALIVWVSFTLRKLHLLIYLPIPLGTRLYITRNAADTRHASQTISHR